MYKKIAHVQLKPKTEVTVAVIVAQSITFVVYPIPAAVKKTSPSSLSPKTPSQ